MSASEQPSATQNPRFSGIRTFMRLSIEREVPGADVLIRGIPFDTAASFRPGARFGTRCDKRYVCAATAVQSASSGQHPRAAAGCRWRRRPCHTGRYHKDL